jgi:hypothetical protein
MIPPPPPVTPPPPLPPPLQATTRAPNNAISAEQLKKRRKLSKTSSLFTAVPGVARECGYGQLRRSTSELRKASVAYLPPASNARSSRTQRAQDLAQEGAASVRTP